MDDRYLETEVYLNSADSLRLEDLGISADDPGTPAPCVIDLWAVTMFWKPQGDIGTIVQIGSGDPSHIILPFGLFALAFKAAAERRQYVVMVDQV